MGDVPLKNKLRNITVRKQSFVYWYLSGKDFVLNISPKEDKTSKVTLVFSGVAPDDDPVMFWAFYEIKALKDNTKTLICLARPKFIAEIISHFLDNADNPFEKGNTNVLNDAMDLLIRMGYTDLNPVWIREW